MRVQDNDQRVLMHGDERACCFDESSKGLLRKASVLSRVHWLDSYPLSVLTPQLVERHILVADARNSDIYLRLQQGADIESFFADSILDYQNCGDLWRVAYNMRLRYVDILAAFLVSHSFLCLCPHRVQNLNSSQVSTTDMLRDLGGHEDSNRFRRLHSEPSLPKAVWN